MATIKLYLVHDDPKRLRTAEISNWNGMALAAPRTEMDELLGRKECERAGVYILTGSDPETDKPMAYLGEAENLKERLKAHNEKEFWVHAIAFFSKDENLTKAHVRYLEGQMIQEARAIKRVTLENANESTTRLPESDLKDMEVFLDKIRQLLPVLGSDLLTPVVQKDSKSPAPRVLETSIKGLIAKGQRTSDGFVVFKDSQAVLQERPSAGERHPFVVERRLALLSDGGLVPQGDHLVFTRDVPFTSPSTAAAIVHGGGVNGLINWRNAVGKTLKEIEEE